VRRPDRVDPAGQRTRASVVGRRIMPRRTSYDARDGADYAMAGPADRPNRRARRDRVRARAARARVTDFRCELFDATHAAIDCRYPLFLTYLAHCLA
jgi:hypothetical protein